MSEEDKKLKKAIVVGAAWVTMLRVFYRLIGLVSTIILARLLLPEDFGIAAIAMSIFGFINAFSKFGFETVLVQHKSPSSDHYSSAWTFNFLFGVVASILLASVSGYVGEFYNNEDITDIVIVISTLFFLNGIKNTGVIDFQKDMAFDKEFRLLIAPKLISFFITIALAIYLRNFWALVIGNVVLKVLEVANSYLMHSFRPRFTFNKGKELFHFSKWLIVNNFLIFINLKSPELILGKIISPQAAAIYNLAAEMGQMATSEIIANLNRAIYPGYSKVSSDMSKLRNLYQDSIKAISMIIMPLGAGVALVSPYIVPIILGEQWLDSIEPLVYISLGGAVYALKSNSNYVYFSLGKPRIATFELVIRTLAYIPVMFYFINKFGVLGAAQSFLIVSVIMFFVSNLIMFLVLKLSFKTQLLIYAKPLYATLLMAMVVNYVMSHLVIGNLILDLMLSVVSGVFSYVAAIVLLWVLQGKPEGIERKAIILIAKKLKK